MDVGLGEGLWVRAGVCGLGVRVGIKAVRVNVRLCGCRSEDEGGSR